MKKIIILILGTIFSVTAIAQPNFSLVSISAPSPILQYDCYSVTATLHNNGSAGTFDFECDLLNSSGTTWYRYIEKKCSNSVSSGGNITLTFSTSSTSTNANHSSITQSAGSYSIQIVALFTSCFSCGNTGCASQGVGALTPITINANSCPGYCMSSTGVTTCSGTFYDSGGNGKYGNNENYTKTFTPSVTGNKVQLSFTSFAIETNWDYMYIYDGPSTASPLIGTYNGTTSPGTVTATNANGQLTVKFTSDGSNNCSTGNWTGWQATISCTSSCIAITNFNLTSQTVSVTAPSAASFSISPSGTSPTYQWQYSTNGGSSWSNVPNSSPYSGVTTSTLTINPTSISMNGYMYRVYLSNACSSGYSNWGTLNVSSGCTNVSITSNPSNQSVTAPSSALFTVSATGTTPFTYQWQVSTNGGSSWSNLREPLITSPQFTSVKSTSCHSEG